jgi:hypothetical protein
MSDDKYWRGEETANRHSWRISLFTLIITILVIGALLGANMTTYSCTAYHGTEPTGTCTGQGWPFNFRPTVFGNSVLLDPNPFALVADIFVAAAIFLTVTSIAEHLIRRRERNRLPEEPR